MFRAGPCFAKPLAWHAFGSHSDMHRHVGDTSGHIRTHGGTSRTHGAEEGGHTGKHRTHSKKWGGHTGYIADTSGFRHTWGTRGHIPTSQAHALNVLCLCPQPICFLSQPDSFRFSATPTCFEMALQGQETPLLEERPKTSSFKTWALHDDFLLSQQHFVTYTSTSKLAN